MFLHLSFCESRRDDYHFGSRCSSLQHYSSAATVKQQQTIIIIIINKLYNQGLYSIHSKLMLIKLIIPVLLWLNVAMPDCQNKERKIKELTDLYEIPFKVKEILQ